MFKKGDIVELIGKNFQARLGALATVTKQYDGEYFYINWDEKDPRRQSQSHGAYFPKSFKLYHSFIPPPVDKLIPRFKQVGEEL